MHKLIKSSICLLFGFIIQAQVLAASANLSTYTIQLNSRQAEDVIPLIKPFLHPDGVIQGAGYKILLKTSEKNYRDLLQFVAELDVSLRQLRISVTLDRELVQRENQSLSDQKGTTAKTDNKPILENLTRKRYTTGRRDKTALTQQVQTQEGKWARISTGESVPVGQRTRNPDGTMTESITYKSVDSGFQVLPRINGEQVNLFIRSQLDNPHKEGGGRIQTRSAETNVTGKLNQWILIGGTAAEAEINQPGSRIYSTSKRKQSHNQIFVKVEIIQ